MMLLIQSLATEAAAVAVGGAAICRLSGMHLVRYDGVRHKAAWVMVYMAMLLGCIAAVHESIIGEPSYAALLLLAGAGGYLWQSRSTWREGPPEFMQVRPAAPLPEPFNLAAGQGEQAKAWPWPRKPGE